MTELALMVQLAEQLVTREPDRILLIEAHRKWSVKDIWTEAEQLAALLDESGLSAGDVVAMQLPNWGEAAVIYLAASMIGAVVNPILPILREEEVRFSLADSRTRAFFIPRDFRGHDYVAMMGAIVGDLPDLRDIFVLRGDAGPFRSWDECCAGGRKAAPLAPLSADSVKLLMYTSGTTGRPKGVLHSHLSLRREIDSYVEQWSLDRDDVIFMASPVSHVTGCLLAFELPWLLDAPVVLQDKWNAAEAVQLFLDHGVSFTVSSTPFLRELLAAAQDRREPLPLFRRFTCGGMAVPPELIRNAHRWFSNAAIGRCYGMTEVPSITLSPRSRDELMLAAETDGIVAPGVRLKMVDPVTGAAVGFDHEGEILVSAPEQFIGYLRPEDNAEAFDADGYFHTGDIGILSGEGVLTITGRKKDLIIRGGENISPAEIETILARHADIGEAAVVSMPHARLGEGVACFIVPRPGATVDQAGLARFLEGEGLAKQKIPERVELVATLPRNTQGKVLKAELRDRMWAICGGA